MCFPLDPPKEQVSVPVRGMDCIEVVTPYIDRYRLVSVPVRGMDCINAKNLIIHRKPVVSVPVRGMDCIPGGRRQTNGDRCFSPREGYGLHHFRPEKF